MKTIINYVLIFAIFLAVPLIGDRAVTTLSNNLRTNTILIIDAGHGGVDGGAVSCTGAYESHINLEIAHRLNDLMHILGVHTIMIREDDRSVYTQGTTIAAKKVSDIRERVRIVNTTPHAIFLSVHQNNYSDSKYDGAQVFYNSIPESKDLAAQLQSAIRLNLNPNNRRQHKKSTGVYLMDHINCIGVLIECGFLSNPEEEMKLRDSSYQKKLCSVIAVTMCQYLNT